MALEVPYSELTRRRLGGLSQASFSADQIQFAASFTSKVIRNLDAACRPAVRRGCACERKHLGPSTSAKAHQAFCDATSGGTLLVDKLKELSSFRLLRRNATSSSAPAFVMIIQSIMIYKAHDVNFS